MNWHLATASGDSIAILLADIRRAGGTIASCRRCAEGMVVTWFTR
ncbi:hypothetical protein [Nocardioides immobilis]|nr:hypothetical protein [Nocardioides immobilis]